nr:DNA-binding protein HEXBP [Tanacetum cinerariifolium]
MKKLCSTKVSDSPNFSARGNFRTDGLNLGSLMCSSSLYPIEFSLSFFLSISLIFYFDLQFLFIRVLIVEDGCCKLCVSVTHLAKDCPNKGNESSGMSNEFRKRWKNTFIIYEANYYQKCGDDEKSDNARTQQSTIEIHDDHEKSLLNQMLSLRPTQQV